MSHFYEILSLGAQVFGVITSAVTSLATGTPVNLPEIRTYVGGKHISLNITIKSI